MPAEVLKSQNFVSDAIDLITSAAEASINQQGWFRLSLCGGGTPKPIYKALGELGDKFPWEQVILTFGDERCVPPDHADSNYRMVKETLLDHVPVPAHNVLRLRGELAPEAAAKQAEKDLDALTSRLAIGEFNHDLILLGLGGDGHTASLFPGSTALQVETGRVVPNYVEKLDAHRLTFTYPFINRARRILFLINDPSKDAVVQEVVEQKGNHPAARIQPASGKLTFLLGA